jgi:hypothetical protein
MPLGAVGWGLVAAAAIGGTASVVAADKQSKAAHNATNLQEGIYKTGQENLAPYMQQGVDAGTRLSDLMGTSGNKGAQGYGSLTQGFTGQDYLNNRDPATNSNCSKARTRSRTRKLPTRAR